VTLGEALLVVATGLGAGVLSSTVGVASLLSFPVLVALGLPPVVANVTNTLGLIPGGLGGVVGYRSEVREAGPIAKAIVVVCALGAAVGAALLLGLPASVFEAVVPWLILGTCLLVGVQPRLKRWVRARGSDPDESDPSTVPPVTRLMATLTGVYGGYFGAGSGVMMLAVLGLGTSLEFRVLNALKTYAVMVSNVVATLVFVVLAPVDWQAVVVLAAGSVVGGYVGSHIGRALPEAVLRTLVVVAGVAAAVLLW
jgi:uncharacterized protein